ncbi:beta-glucosidase [termite gut metagenome]|uniref:Beta-glucosidase n=1 Tax=termite gut metagenome TaxID=433724 RepID=A0A5J4RDG3_9ZZZZ
MNTRRITIAALSLLVLVQSATFAQKKGVTSVSASVNANQGALLLDNNSQTAWELEGKDLQNNQFLVFTLLNPGDVKEIQLEAKGISKEEIQKSVSIFITYDPMNLGEAVKYNIQGNQKFFLTFPPKYGAHVQVTIKGNTLKKPVAISEIAFVYAENASKKQVIETAQPWMNATLPVGERVELLLVAMTPSDKMELIREGWGIPGIPHLGIPDIKKVEAVHGFSYGSGATIFPQAIGMGATWNKRLVENVAKTIGDETLSAGAIQAWSPVLDVAQDARWGRCEETFGEDPILVSQIGGAWIKGYQSLGLMTTPKHFAIHGAPLGGRDSHDIGLSEREIREVHLVPFRHVIREYNCQSIMMAYSDYLGVPIAKSQELLKGILREEWGFNGFIVSDCGAIGNLTARKHYTAVDYIDAANQALAAGIATNCGDVYNNKEVIAAANRGELDMENLDNACRTMLSTMFRKGLFENNPSKSLDWNKKYTGWQSPEHKEMARESARQSIVLLKNKADILPLSKTVKAIAVIGPGADDLQLGDYTGKQAKEQLKSVLTGIKEAVSSQTKVTYEKGCDFFYTENTQIEKAVKAAQQADIAVLVLGDCSNSESSENMKKTSGENHDFATLVLPGDQQRLLEAVCATGKPIILILQAGRPYNLSYAAEHCQGILVNWLPGQEGGYATADVLFGEYNPAGRLPMTFPRHVGQVPDYYNFKTSGRRYEYSDMEYYPLFPFGYGLSYTKFKYANLQNRVNEDGTLTVQAEVTNTGNKAGDEVVQLYVTDMYASAKTRVMELKDFERITLAPGETKKVSFTLTPYQLSLLNDQMDRVVEPGEFRINVGGKSPSYRAGDRIKDSVTYGSESEGITGKAEYPKAYAADFTLTYSGIEENLIYNKKRAVVKVKNTGNIMDTGKAQLFVNGAQTGEVHHYELNAGEEKTITFDLDKNEIINELTFTIKYKSITIKP